MFKTHFGFTLLFTLIRASIILEDSIAWTSVSSTRMTDSFILVFVNHSVSTHIFYTWQQMKYLIPGNKWLILGSYSWLVRLRTRRHPGTSCEWFCSPLSLSLYRLLSLSFVRKRCFFFCYIIVQLIIKYKAPAPAIH